MLSGLLILVTQNDSFNSALYKSLSGTHSTLTSRSEEILSTRNADAQFYRSLRRNGIWQEMKQEHVHNFPEGGMVGAGSRTEAPRYRAGQRVGGDTNVTIVQNIYTPDANSFRRSEGQMARDSAATARRAYERNG